MAIYVVDSKVLGAEPLVVQVFQASDEMTLFMYVRYCLLVNLNITRQTDLPELQMASVLRALSRSQGGGGLDAGGQYTVEEIQMMANAVYAVSIM